MTTKQKENNVKAVKLAIMVKLLKEAQTSPISKKIKEAEEEVRLANEAMKARLNYSEQPAILGKIICNGINK